jgi:hypothetical protein
MREIVLPNSAAIRAPGHAVGGADWTIHQGSTAIRFHPNWCYLQPWVLAALASWGQRQLSGGGAITVENDRRAAYAWRFGLHEFLGFEPERLPEEHEEAGRFLSLRAIATSADLSALLADLVPLLHLGDEPERARAVQYAMSEMVTNTIEHSASVAGAVVCAQFYPGKTPDSRRYVSIGIADTGRGVRTSLATNYPDLESDEEAVLKALEPGVTGAVSGMYGSVDNAGAGLFITRRLCAATWSYFGLYSGDAFFVTSIAERPPSDLQLVRTVAPFPGTVVCVELDVRRDADFAAMLASARTAFGRGSDEQRAELERRVRFT